MNVETETKALEKLPPVLKLVDIADAMFDRAVRLDGIILTKKNDEAQKTIFDTRDETYTGVINVWKVVIELLPTAGLDQKTRKELEIDGYKVISRCYHRMKNLEAARQAITKAIDLGYADGFISLGAINMDCEDYDEAEKSFLSAVAKGVQLMRAHAGLGELYFKLGTMSLNAKDGKHAQFFTKSEEQFLAAGKERFGEGYERAMELFETIGWKEQAIAFGEKAAAYYEKNRTKYGDKLKNLSPRIRKITGDERYEKILEGLGRGLGNLVGGGVRNTNKEIK